MYSIGEYIGQEVSKEARWKGGGCFVNELRRDVKKGKRRVPVGCL